MRVDECRMRVVGRGLALHTSMQGVGGGSCLLRHKSVAERDKNKDSVCVSSARVRGRVPHALGGAKISAYVPPR
jgi:hypothetical protein